MLLFGFHPCGLHPLQVPKMDLRRRFLYSAPLCLALTRAGNVVPSAATPTEPEQEATFVSFSVQVMELRHVSVQRDIAMNIHKMTLWQTAYNWTKIDFDQPSTSTLLAIIEKGIASVLTKNGCPKAHKNINNRRGNSEYNSSILKAATNTLFSSNSRWQSIEKEKGRERQSEWTGLKPSLAKLGKKQESFGATSATLLPSIIKRQQTCTEILMSRLMIYQLGKNSMKMNYTACGILPQYFNSQACPTNWMYSDFSHLMANSSYTHENLQMTSPFQNIKLRVNIRPYEAFGSERRGTPSKGSLWTSMIKATLQSQKSFPM